MKDCTVELERIKREESSNSSPGVYSTTPSMSRASKASRLCTIACFLPSTEDLNYGLLNRGYERIIKCHVVARSRDWRKLDLAVNVQHAEGRRDKFGRRSWEIPWFCREKSRPNRRLSRLKLCGDKSMPRLTGKTRQLNDEGYLL